MDDLWGLLFFLILVLGRRLFTRVPRRLPPNPSGDTASQEEYSASSEPPAYSADAPVPSQVGEDRGGEAGAAVTPPPLPPRYRDDGSVSSAPALPVREDRVNWPAGVVQGVIWAEILGAPKARSNKNPRR